MAGGVWRSRITAKSWPGDPPTKVGDEPVWNMDEYIRAIEKHKIGQPITLQVRRGDHVREVTLTLMDIS